MAARNYWLDLFSGATWQEFLDAGSSVSGFRESRWAVMRGIKPGDYLLCYLTGVSRFVGVLEVTSAAFRDSAPIWKDEHFPCRLRVRVVAALTPETAVPVHDLSDRLSMFRNMKHPLAWTGRFRGSPAKWSISDGEAVVEAVVKAQRSPVARPVDPAKLGYRPKAIRTRKLGPVTVPDSESGIAKSEEAKEPRAHSEMQWLLLKLGSDMGLGVWAARNDRNREVGGRKFAKLPGFKSELPVHFDEATNRTIELIDVLWLQGNTIVAAFEIESTTSIYSGLLRMSDLIAMQPNLNIPLYLVAPEERREKVLTEVNRPTFSRLKPPMSQMCRFLSFQALRKSIDGVASYVKHVKPEFLLEVAESCEIEEL
ncbi:MAG: EVE domain-containing protein [Armatimonadetes bacterium]|nr:EVE domain-containing protein [Armatimonadota bacterium]